MEYWIVYDIASGEPLYPGSGTLGQAAVQQVPEGAELMMVPQQILLGRAWPNLDLAILRIALSNGIDAEAEQIRQRFLTPGAGQAMTYQRKEAEARAWMADNTAPTPFLSAEAPARDVTVADLAAEVIMLADQWTAIGSAIEGLRMGAKAALQRAGTFGQIIAAAKVDWDSIRAPAA